MSLITRITSEMLLRGGTITRGDVRFCGLHCATVEVLDARGRVVGEHSAYGDSPEDAAERLARALGIQTGESRR